jgi:hypothetical protein
VCFPSTTNKNATISVYITNPFSLACVRVKFRPQVPSAGSLLLLQLLPLLPLLLSELSRPLQHRRTAVGLRAR